MLKIKSSKKIRDSIIELISPGSLWICQERHWYFYKFTTEIFGFMNLNGNITRPKRNRHIKYVHQNVPFLYQEEELITKSSPLLFLETSAGIFYFQNNLEKIEMRAEFLYRFAADWRKQ